MSTLAADPPRLSEAQHAEFHEQGFLVVPGLVIGELLADIARGYHRAVAGEIDEPRWRQRWRPRALLQLPDPCAHIPELQPRRHIARLVAVGRQLLGPGIDFWYDQLIFKPAGDPWETPWHQDAGYWRQLGPDFPGVTAWLAVADVDADMGCMSFVPGSHRGGVCEHRSVADRNPINGALQAVADTAAAVKVPLRAGDVTFHHSRTLHHTAGNSGRRDRMGLVHHLGDRPWLESHGVRLR